MCDQEEKQKNKRQNGTNGEKEQVKPEGRKRSGRRREMASKERNDTVCQSCI